MKKLIIILLSITIFTTYSFAHEPGSEINFIDAQQAYEILKQDNTVFIDHRPAEAFALSHISNAVSMPYEGEGSPENNMTKEMIESLMSKDKIVLYCSKGKRNKEAFKQIMKWGFDKQKFYLLKDGFFEWQQNNLPISP